MKLRWQARAAKALDETHAIGERGPRTFIARNRLAGALDNNRPYMALAGDVKWLENVKDCALERRRNRRN